MRACMGRPFREALASTPVVLEIVPPGRRVSEKAVNAFVERVRDSVHSLENLNGVNIPEVLEAKRILRTVTKGRDDIALGNITIAERDHEVDRLVEKTHAGCDFFTTQVLFEAEPMATVLRAYGGDVPPRT